MISAIITDGFKGIVRRLYEVLKPPKRINISLSGRYIYLSVRQLFSKLGAVPDLRLHRRWINTSYNATSKDMNYPFNSLALSRTLALWCSDVSPRLRPGLMRSGPQSLFSCSEPSDTRWRSAVIGCSAALSITSYHIMYWVRWNRCDGFISFTSNISKPEKTRTVQMMGPVPHWLVFLLVSEELKND